MTSAEQALRDEIGAHLTAEILGNEKFIERIVRQDANLAERILGKIQDLAEGFRTLGNPEARTEYKRLKKAEGLFLDAIKNAGLDYRFGKIEKNLADSEGEEIVNGEVDKENGEKPKKITTEMTDDERYQILKNRSISLSAIADNKKMEAAQKRLELSEKDIEFSEYGDRVRLFKKLGTEFSVYQTYRNRDIQLDFRFSKEKMRESVSKQQKNYICFAKMLSCLDDVIDNAIGIEVHNRNEDGYKRDDTLRNVYVLASAFVDGEKIFPVKLEVKEFTDKQNTLHVAIALESIKKDGSVKQEVANAGVARQYSVPSVISIAEYFRKINPSDESFYKYIPKPFLQGKSQFSLKPFANQIDDVLGGADTTSTHLKVMDTPKLLQEAGLPNLPILLTANHLKSITRNDNGAKGNANYHDLDIDFVKRLPEYISDPVLIADSFTNDKSVVIITEAIDNQNRPVIAAILLSGDGRLERRHIKANILTSAYGKDNFQSFLNKIGATDATIYWNKKKSQSLSVSLGVQFPNAITNLDSNTIIRKAKAFVKINEQKNTGKSHFSLKPQDAELMRETERRRNFNFSEGEELKAEANENHKKVYTKKDASAIVSAVLSEYMSFGEVYGNLHGKSRAEIVDMLWKGLNAAKPGLQPRVNRNQPLVY